MHKSYIYIYEYREFVSPEAMPILTYADRNERNDDLSPMKSLRVWFAV